MHPQLNFQGHSVEVPEARSVTLWSDRAKKSLVNMTLESIEKDSRE